MLGHKDGYDVAEEHAELGETPVSIHHVIKSVFFLRFFLGSFEELSHSQVVNEPNFVLCLLRGPPGHFSNTSPSDNTHPK